MLEPLRIEISRPQAGVWRVVERSHHAAESVFRVPFDAAELADLLTEINVCLLDANATPETQTSRLRRLGGRLAEMTLPVVLREKLSTHAGLAEFFLDDASIILPVELYPHSDGVLGEAMPVSRHWFCEDSQAPRRVLGRKERQFLIVADPAENLPAAQKEGKALFRKIRAQKGWKCRFFGRAATAAELSREIPDTDILHLAAHYVAGENQAESGVMTSDGLWLPTDVFPTPEVVFANCCHAGLPLGEDGNLSLVGHFLKHGSRHVIAPFLPASDQAAYEFAQEFYQALVSGKDVAQSVWLAKKAIGPASWMYWHFGPTVEQPAQAAAPVAAPKEKRGYFWPILTLMMLSFAAIGPWLTPIKEIEPHPDASVARQVETPTKVIDEPLPVEPAAVVMEEPPPTPTLPETSVAVVEPDGTPVIEEPEEVEPIPPVAAALPAELPPPVLIPDGPGLFDRALTEVEGQQSFEEAFIQVLDGYPENYLNAVLVGEPDYDAASGKATVTVEVTIDDEKYRGMTASMGETLRRFGHSGEEISATMKRPYDSFTAIYFENPGKIQFRDLLLLCTQTNGALTNSEWEIYEIPRNSIDAILSSMSLPVLSVALVDRSGVPVATQNKGIPRPFVATEERALMFMPVFENGEADMTITSLIPGENRLLVKMDFDLSVEELKRIAGATCVVKKGNRLPTEFRYRFLRK